MVMEGHLVRFVEELNTQLLIATIDLIEAIKELIRIFKSCKLVVCRIRDSHQANIQQSTAYFATPESVCDPSWYEDKRATNHVAADLANLSMNSEYRGADRLAVGNEQ